MFVSSNALMRGVLSEAEGDGTGGGDAPKALTEEDVGRIVNSAVTAHLKRELPKAIGGALTPALEAALKPIQEHLAKVPQGEQAGDTSKPSPELAALKRQLEEQTKIIEVERSARLDAEKKQRMDHARSAVLGHIDTAVKPELKEFLSDYLFNRVEFDDAGAPLIRVGGGEDALPLKDGIASFLKTKEASAFLPAPVVKPGPGARGPTRPTAGIQTYDKPATTDEEKARRAFERESAIEAANR